MRAFRFNKGETVPVWVMHCSFGSMVFGCNGKLFILGNNNLVATTLDKRCHKTFISFDGFGETLTIVGAGIGNDTEISWCIGDHKESSAHCARKFHGIKNKAKLDKLPTDDPRIMVENKLSGIALDQLNWEFRDIQQESDL